MNRIVTWTRLPGLLTLGAAAFLVSCDAPTSPAGLAPLADDPVVFASKNKTTGLKPSPTPQCTDPWDEGRVLCRAEVNTKHGNDKGLPVNLSGIRNSNQLNGNVSGANLMVTVLGTPRFDLSAVYMNTILAGDVNTNPPATPVSLLPNGKYQASIVDLNGDGILDLLLHFSIPAMVKNGDLSEITTQLCLYGEGPGYVLNGCGMGGGGGGNGGGGEPPPPYYSTLKDCSWDYKAKPGLRCAILQLFGRDGKVAAKVLQTQAFFSSPDAAFPGWMTTAAVGLTGSGNVTGDFWRVADLPFGSEASNALGFLSGTCGLTPSVYRWEPFYQLLVRTDLYVPPEAQSVQIEFLVDDLARVYFNGTELTRDWVGSGVNGTCVNYGQTVKLTVPATLLAADGNNRLGVWAYDAGGFVNWLDVRVFAEVPVS